MITPQPNLTTLYVEDEDNDVLLLQHAWRQASISQPLEIARNGNEALNYFQTHSGAESRPGISGCSLVLLDLNLPQVTGFELLSWVRGHAVFKRLPVIILTSSNQKHDIHLAYDLGANAFLVKPSSLEELIQLVRCISHFWLERNRFPDPC